MTPAKPALLAALAMTALAAASPPVSVTTLPEYQTARATAKAVLDSTRALLTQELEAYGPAGAIESCSAVAIALAVEHEREGWRVRRVSLKLRNPADAPDAFERRMLQEWGSRHRRSPLDPATEHVAVVDRVGHRSLRYMKPIVVSELCLACHGPARSLSPEVRGVLRERYPKDRATGYRAGDLRGAISVSIPLGSESR
jgi:hypothetical protein